MSELLMKTSTSDIIKLRKRVIIFIFGYYTTYESNEKSGIICVKEDIKNI